MAFLNVVAQRIFNIKYRSGDTLPQFTTLPLMKVADDAELATFLNSLAEYTNSTIVSCTQTNLKNDQPIATNTVGNHRPRVFTYQVMKSDGSDVAIVKFAIPEPKGNLDALAELVRTKIGKWGVSDIVNRIG